MTRTLGLVVIVLIGLPLVAEAQTYRCTGKDGKKYYGATIPPQCVGVAIEQLSPQGVVVRRIEGTLTAEEKAKRDADIKAASDREDQAKEEARRNRALLAAYQSEQDIETARKRALEENDKGVAEIQARLDQQKKRLDGLGKEMEFYQGKNKPPARLVEDVKDGQATLKDLDAQLARKKDVSAINARFDDDKRRFADLQGKDVRERAAAMGVEKKAYTSSGTSSSATGRVAPSGTTSTDSSRRTLTCGNSVIVCSPSSVVVCQGQRISCK